MNVRPQELAAFNREAAEAQVGMGPEAICFVKGAILAGWRGG